MKSIITFVLLLACTLGFSQLTNEGSPASWELRNDEGLAPIVMPGFDLASLQKEDLENDGKMEKPYRFGYEFLVDYNLGNSGKWQTLENGDRIWRIRFYSEGAKSMNFLFSDFYMPEGATLYLYSNDREDLLGAYDSRVNNAERVLGTWLVKGKDIWLEYYEPKDKMNQGKLEIFKLVHGYRGPEDIIAKSTNELNSSGSCHYDVDCSMGANVDNTGLKNINKKGVAMIVMGGGLCTGTMINNVNNDGTPYFLTANHCYNINPNQWSFRFNWISPNPVCAATTNSTNGTESHVMSGAVLRARREKTDFCLVELNQNPNPAWDITWVGWSRNTNLQSPAYGIHHPDGDIMKVSKDNQTPIAVTVNLDGVDTDMWQVDWDMGVTEGGSSGSALFNSQGRLIGQLYGGTSGCAGIFPGGGPDIYGRFDVSWNNGTLASQRLQNWLDPDNTNTMQVNYYPDGPVGLDEVAAVNEVKIYPNPSNGIFNVSLGDASEMSYEVYNILGQTVKSGKLTADNNTVNLTDSKEGVYILKLTDTANNTSATRKIVKE